MPTVACFVAHVAPPTQADVTVTQAQTLCGQYLHFFGVPSSYLPRPYDFHVYPVVQRWQILSQLCRINSQLFKYGNSLSEKASVFVGIGKYNMVFNI